MIVIIDEQKAMMEIMGFAKFNTTKVNITIITTGLFLSVWVCLVALMFVVSGVLWYSNRIRGKVR